MAFCIRYVHLHTPLSSVPTLFFSSLWFVSSVFRFFVGRIRLVSILVSFALPLFCILHVRSLLVILCSFPCLSFLLFSVTVSILWFWFEFDYEKKRATIMSQIFFSLLLGQ